MTILSGIYASTTSLFSFSRALNLISDNVANLNTLGFRGSDAFFESIAGPVDNGGASGGTEDNIGEGTQFRGAGRRFTAGEIRATGNASDLAINGEGFFVLKGDDGIAYTRAGQFQLDENGHLVDPSTGMILQGLDGTRVEDLSIDLKKVNPAKATTSITLTGTLPVQQSGGSTTPTTVNNVTAYTADGVAHTLSVTFTAGTQEGSLSVVDVAVKDENGATLTLPGSTIKFSGSGSPAPGFNTLQITLGSGENASDITLDFGDPGGIDGVRYLSAPSSTVTAKADDGYATGQVTSYAFDSSGVVTLQFSNGQSETSAQLALAYVANPQHLQSADGRLFTVASEKEVIIGKPSNGSLGALVPKNVELANVDLSKEFADIIILQRGYQASSQILNVSNEMIEDVYNGVSGRQ
jgi:flagellar hook protein FlgE